MKKLLIGICVSLFCIVGCVKEFKVPPLTGRVVDTTKTLSKEDIKHLEALIKGFEANTKGQFAVCIVSSLEGLSIEQASMKVAETWKIGYKGKDNGILFLLAMKEREYRLEIGYGFEGKLNDAKCGDIGRQLITPAFKEKKWAKGIGLAIQKCDFHISGKQTEELKKVEEESSHSVWFWIVIILVIIIFAFIKVALEDDSCGCSGGNFFSGGGSSRGGGFGGGGGGFGGGGFSGKF